MPELDDFEKDLERLLKVYRFDAPPPDFRRVTPMAARRQRRWPALAAAAAIVVVIGAAMLYPRRNDWRIEGRLSRLSAGEVVRATRDVRLSSRAVGVVDVAAGTTLRLVENQHRHRIALEAGTIHARTISPPGLFIVDTPRARAIDLGCEYVLTVANDGSGTLRVTSGWVALRHDWAESFVPQGAAASIGANGQLSAPVFEDASPEFRAAASNFARDHDVATVTRLARPRDLLTLLSLFRPATSEERVLLYDAVTRLLPHDAPRVSREAVRYWEPETTEGWWRYALRAANIGPLKKPKGMLWTR
jgi:hypothetical protein